MPKIPADAHVVTDRRLTAIKAISQLYDRFVDCAGGLKDQVKDALQKKHANYGQSDLVTAQLRPGGRTTADTAKVYGLIAAGQITLDQFLSFATINVEKLKTVLSGEQIAQVSAYKPYFSPSLYTDWKEGVVFDGDQLIEAIEQTLRGKGIAVKKRRAG